MYTFNEGELITAFNNNPNLLNMKNDYSIWGERVGSSGATIPVHMRYAIDSRKLQAELGWEPSLQFEEGIEKTVRWYLDNQEWMDNITSGDYEKYYDDMYKNR